MLCLFFSVRNVGAARLVDPTRRRVVVADLRQRRNTTQRHLQTRLRRRLGSGRRTRRVPSAGFRRRDDSDNTQSFQLAGAEGTLCHGRRSLHGLGNATRGVRV